MVDLNEVKRVAELAGEKIMKVYQDGFLVTTKGDNSPVTTADTESHRIIQDKLSGFGWPIISEEGGEIVMDGKDKYVWLVDPLDGTRDFIQKTGEFCVMIALVEEGEPVLAVVYWPTKEECFFAEKNKGARSIKGGKKGVLQVSEVAEWREATVINSRNHPEEMWSKESLLGVRKIRHMGSAGLKGAMVAEGEVDIYLNTSGAVHQWDICAAVLLVEEAGGKVTDCLGKQIVFGNKEADLPNGYVMSNGKVHGQALEMIDRFLN